MERNGFIFLKSGFYFTKKKIIYYGQAEPFFLMASHQTELSIVYKPSDMYKHSNKSQL